ncbi:efflux RND transporter permease subunit, partial [Burkholderia contaminans]
AITLAVTIVISAIVSLTLVPMLCAKLLRHSPPPESHRFEARVHRAIDWVIARYAVALEWVLNRQRSTLVVALL